MNRRNWFGINLLALLTLLTAAIASTAQPAAAVSPNVVISQVYGGGGNGGATYTHDFIELFNRGSAPVSLSGWSVQYASATGTSWQVTSLSGSIAPGQYYLVQQAQGSGGTTALPTPDATGNIALSATAGKVALVNTTTALTGACPTAGVVDFVGFGSTANCFEGSGPTAAPGNTTAVLRVAGGCTDTDNNAADFATGAPTPRNTSAPLNPCGGAPTPTPTPTEPPAACALPDTPIGEVQGSTETSPKAGQSVTVQGVVVGDYEGPSPNLRGFYLQEMTQVDSDPLTSEGIFVFNGDNNRVSLGQVVQVTGNVSEFQGQTQVSASVIELCGTTATVEPAEVTLPFPSADYLERYEGMLVRFPQTLYVTEHFQLGRFGQVVVSSGGRLQQPTNVVEPGAAALALQAANNLNRIIVDDHLNSQNPDPILFGRGGAPLSASNTLRGGDTVTDLVGVMTYTWAGNAASGNAYRVRPINDLSDLAGNVAPNFQPANARPAQPSEVGGRLRVTAFNVLNYFNTFSGCTLGVGGATTDCRGAENQTEFNRQWPKTVAAILGSDADVIGIMEMENDGYGPTSAIQDLVNRLNEATAPGTYAFIDADAATGQVNALGTDAIKVAAIYRPASVTPVGATAVLNSPAFVTGGDSAPRNRPALAQSFRENATGATFTVVVNHLKSKGSACDAPDAGDGQGNCNLVRVNAANLLVEWLATDPTGVNDPDVLIIGDLNSYAREDPITTIRNAGYTNLIEAFVGADAYSYAFDGQWGYLDYALASHSLAAQVSGVTEWHINADEPTVLDYNTNFKSAGQIASLYAPDQYRSSDHDPVIIGLNLNAAPVANDQQVTTDEDTPVSFTLDASDGNGDSLTYTFLSQPVHGTLSGTAPHLTYTSHANYNGSDSFTYQVSDGALESRVATVTIIVQAINDAPIAVNDSAATKKKKPIIINVVANDSDVDGDPLRVIAVTQGSRGGIIGIVDHHRVSYAPAKNFKGVETFTYTISDGNGGTATAIVTVTVK